MLRTIGWRLGSLAVPARRERAARRDGQRAARRGWLASHGRSAARGYRDPFFEDPVSVEDDYRRFLNRGR